MEKVLNADRTAELWTEIGKRFDNKQDKLAGQVGQVVGFDKNSNVVSLDGWSNQNLLKNWDFRRPVNRQGKPVYHQTGGYTIDLWYFYQNHKCSLTLENGYVVFEDLSNDSKGGHIRQSFPSLPDGVYTLSMVLSTGIQYVVYEKTDSVWKRTNDYYYTGSLWIGVQADTQQSGHDVFFIYTNYGQPLNIIAVKMEIGNQQTLARKNENEKWVLNDLFDYEQQYQICSLYDPITGDWIGNESNPKIDNTLTLTDDTLGVTIPTKSVAQAEYDALTEEGKNSGLYVVTDANISLKDRGEVYSTEETIIGTWIDGKPLYRKVYTKVLTGAVSKDILVADLSSLNIGTCIFINAIIQKNNSANHQGTINKLPECSYFESKIIDTKLYVVVYEYTEWLNSLTTCILEYTKTTDPAPSASSVSTQNLPVNSLNSTSQNSEKVATSQVPLPSYVAYAPASASTSSANFTFAPALASSTNLTL